MVVNFENIIQDISKDCLSPKSKICTKDNVKNRNKWMNKSCFKAKRNLTKKKKKKFVKFSNNMGRRLIFLNVKKTYKKTLYLTEKAFKEKNLIKIAELNKNASKQFWTTVKSLLNNTARNRPNSIHPNTWKPYFVCVFTVPITRFYPDV